MLLSTKAESLLPCNFVSIYLKLIEMCEHHIYTDEENDKNVYSARH